MWAKAVAAVEELTGQNRSEFLTEFTMTDAAGNETTEVFSTWHRAWVGSRVNGQMVWAS